MSSPREALIGARPRDAAERWIDGNRDEPVGPKASLYTARLTIDVTPSLRGRIKIVAFERGVTVADMLRDLLEERFGAGPTNANEIAPCPTRS